METPKPDMPSQQPPRPHASSKEEAWSMLLEELTKLNAQLEYVNLMLKLGVGKF